MTGQKKLLLRLVAEADRPLSLAELYTLCRGFGQSLELIDVLELQSDGWLKSDSARLAPTFTLNHRLQSEFLTETMPESVIVEINRALARQTPRSAHSFELLASRYIKAKRLALAIIFLEKAALDARKRGLHNTALNLLQRADDLHGSLSEDLTIRKLLRRAMLTAAYQAVGLLRPANNLSRSVRKDLTRFKHVVKKGLHLQKDRLKRIELMITSTLSQTRHFGGEQPDLVGTLGLGFYRNARTELEIETRVMGMAMQVFLLDMLGLPDQHVRYRFYELRGENFTVRTQAVWDIAMTTIDLRHARWEDAKKRMFSSLFAQKTSDDVELKCLTFTMLAVANHLQGRYDETLKWFDALSRFADHHDLPSYLAWGKYGCAQALVRMGEAEKASTYCDEATALFKGNRDRQSNLLIAGTKCRALALSGERAAAVKLAHRMTRYVQKVAKTNVSSMDGFSGAAWVLATHAEPPNDPAIDIHLAQLRTYARNFPFAEPRYLAIRALTEHRRGKHKRAQKTINMAGQLAEKLQMHGEAASCENIRKVIIQGEELSLADILC